jgi:hypothetical protein
VIGLTVRTLMAGCLMLMIASGVTKAASEQTTSVLYRSVRVDGLSVFYREAGPVNAVARQVGCPVSDSKDGRSLRVRKMA